MGLRRVFLSVLLVLVSSEGARADQLSGALRQRIDAIVRKDMRAAATPGLSLAVVRDDRLAYVRGYGVRDITTHAPVDAQTVFRFGSVSKQFTAAVLLTLAQQRKLSLDAPLATWFPAVRGASDVRLVDLLAQVSGYRDYYPLDYCDLEMSRPASTAAIAREYGAFPLTANPRTRWEYSNTNYLFAGLVAERVAGEPLEVLLRQRIFAPLGMTHTFYDEPMREVADRATGYDSYFTEPQHADAVEAPNWLNAAGALAGTASDLARWDIALMQRRVLDAGSTSAMTTERILMPGNVPTSYGLGQFVASRNGHRIVYHGGNVIGFNAANVMAFDDRTAVVALTNSYEGSADQIARDVLVALIPAIAHRPATSSARSRAPSPAVPPVQSASVKLIERGLAALRNGRLSSAIADADFLALMNPVNTQRARAVLEHLGNVRRVTFEDGEPRGGLMVTTAGVQFARGSRTAVVYETTHGTIAELFLFF